MYAVSLLTSASPASKRFSLNTSGSLTSAKAWPISRGRVQTVRLDSMADFAALLPTLSARDVLMYGTCAHESCQIVTKDDYQRMGDAAQQNNCIPRSKSHFSYKAGQNGILCLDYDPQDGQIYTHDEWLSILYSICAALKNAPLVLTHSASSHIFHGNKMLRGPKGKRIYVGIQDAAEIPRFGLALFRALIRAGHGWTITTSSGVRLERTLIDRAMLSPTQPDYAGGAVCAHPLYQERPAPVILNAEADPLDTRGLLIVRQDEDRPSPAPRTRTASTTTQEAQARTRTGAAAVVSTQYLTHSQVIETKEHGLTTWGEIMRNPSRWHRAQCYDPWHPDKDAMILTRGNVGIFSYLGGGTRYQEMPRGAVITGAPKRAAPGVRAARAAAKG